MNATLDYYDDPVDVYRVQLGKHQKLTAALTAGWTGASVALELWRPGTRKVDVASTVRKLRAAQSASAGAHEQVRFVAPAAGWYFVEAKVNSPGFGEYTLKLAKS